MEDWQVAKELLRSGRSRHGLFFVQLSLEKMLKALVCFHTRDLAPRIHNLVRLAEIAELELTSRQLDILADMNTFNLEGRYPDTMLPLPTPEEATAILSRAEEVFQWLISRLSELSENI